MVFTDPALQLLPIEGHASSSVAIHHRRFRWLRAEMGGGGDKADVHLFSSAEPAGTSHVSAGISLH